MKIGGGGKFNVLKELIKARDFEGLRLHIDLDTVWGKLAFRAIASEGILGTPTCEVRSNRP